MKTMQELINSINGIPELALSEETIGAYLEGTLSPDETDAVEAILNINDELAYFLADIDPIEDIQDSWNGGDVAVQVDPDSIELPSLPMPINNEEAVSELPPVEPDNEWIPNVDTGWSEDTEPSDMHAGEDMMNEF